MSLANERSKTVSLQEMKLAPSERELRIQLAACYRIFDMLGWVEMIFNHITVRVPGPEVHFLINPFGLFYREVTASNLVKIDLQGNPVGPSNFPVNRAGFVIHSAIHGARHDAQCVMHTHTTSGVAIACQKDGLGTNNFYSAMLNGQIAYHDFEGVTVVDDEKPRLLASMGDKNLLILRNHGLLACGDSIASAFHRLWTLQRACDVQLAAQSAGVPLIQPSPAAVNQSTNVPKQLEPGEPDNVKLFAALMRRVDGIDPSYRN